MGNKATVIYEWLKSTKLSPVQLIYMFIAIFAFIFFATDIFEALPDILKVLLYGGTILVGVLLGVSIFDIKKIAEEMKAIYQNKNFTAEEKVNAYGELALKVLSKLGHAWQEYTDEQFEDVKTEKIELLQTKIEKLKKDLADRKVN